MKLMLRMDKFYQPNSGGDDDDDDDADADDDDDDDNDDDDDDDDDYICVYMHRFYAAYIICVYIWYI